MNVRIAAQVATVLHEFGIRRVYGLPGEDHMALLDAFVSAGLDYDAAFNESAAAIMAATEAQVSGLPGVVVLSLAPGVSNGVNGLLNASLDEIPMVLLSGQHSSDSLPFVVRQGFDIAQLVAPLTKWRVKLTSGMNIPAAIGRAVDEAMTGRPGPVYVELPDEVANAASEATETQSAKAVERLRARWVRSSTPPVAVCSTLDALAARLGAAARPVVVVGGRKRRLSPATLARFATACRIPVFTSSRQKGLLDSSCDFYAGTYLNGRLEKDLLGSADLVLMIDPESFDFYNKPWNFSADAVAITDDAFTEWLNPLAAAHVGDPDALLAALTARPEWVSSTWTATDVRTYRDGLRTKLLPDSGSFSVAHAVEGALRSWPGNGYLVADAGFGKPLVAMLSEPSVPDHYFASNALSTMGYAIPATLALRRSGRGPILGFLGDGSLMMRAPEIAASTDDGPGTVYLAIMDRALTQIEVKQERRNLATVGVTLPPISCAKLGDALGVEGVDVTSAEEMSAVVAKGLHGERPVLIGAYVDPAPSRDLFDVLRG